MKDKRHKLPRRGVTLPDITITVLIIGIMAAVAAPKFAGSLHRVRVEAACKRIKADLKLGRSNAMATSTSQVVHFSPSTNTYTLLGVSDLDHSNQVYTVDVAAAPYSVTLSSATLGGDGDVQFDQYGQPDSGGTITIQSGSYQTTVTLDPNTGKASIP